MPSDSPNSLNVLKNTLERIFKVFSQKYFDFGFNFTNDFPARTSIVALGIITAGAEHGRIYVEEIGNDFYRLGISLDSAVFPNVSRGLLVPKKDAAHPLEWLLDESVMARTAKGRVFIDRAATLTTRSDERMQLVTDLLFDGFRKSLESGLARAVHDEFESPLVSSTRYGRHSNLQGNTLH